MSRSFVVFGIRSYAAIAVQVAELTKGKLGEVDVREFPDGERYQRIVTNVSDKDVVLVGGTISDKATLEIYDLACALVKYGARSLDLIIPYFGYSTMERAVKLGEVVTAKTRARLLSSIPSASQGNRALLLDLHSDGIPHYFEGNPCLWKTDGVEGGAPTGRKGLCPGVDRCRPGQMGSIPR